MLAERQRKIGSYVCVGLDPKIDKMPACFNKPHHTAGENAYYWMADVVDKTSAFSCAYKPNSAFFEALPLGAKWLENLISYIHFEYPGIPVLLDGKRGDIGATQQFYRQAHLSEQGQNADGMTFSPYMGKDTMSALVNSNDLGKALVGICYTTNPSARKMQNVVLEDGRPYWDYVAQCTMEWAQELGVIGDAGLVMAAAYEKVKGSGRIYSKHLEQARGIVRDRMWFLIPGIGTQKGFVKETVSSAWCGPGSMAINSSSGITEAEDPAAAARELRDKINEAIPADCID